MMTDYYTDRDLITLFVDNDDPDGYTRLYTRYYKRLRSAVSDIVDDNDLDDIMQETFLKLYSFLPKFKGRSSMFTVLYTMARNSHVDLMRKRKNQILDGAMPMYGLDNECLIDSLINSVEDLDKWVLGMERNDTISQALDELDDDLRSVLVLREYHGLEYREIADIMDIPEGTVKSKLSRARIALREGLIQ